MKPDNTYSGVVVKGKFIPNDPFNFRKAFYHLEGKEAMVSVKKKTKRRSNPQNKYLWGVVYALIADHIGEDPESVHDLMKVKFNFKHITTESGKELKMPQTTTKLTTDAFEVYWKSIQRWAAEFLELYIPDPSEVMI